ncbi:MAG: V-type ATP synthase subunit E [Lachnospiraceae bacterium]|nr:V-type ATP synthase subunit E [Lachnospiraceae bacterium]
MTLEEKFKNFYNNSIASANASAQLQISEHEAALEKIFNEHRETMQRQTEAELKAEQEKLKREMNKQLSTEQLHIKRSLSKKTQELKDKLFQEVSVKLQAFMKTPEYTRYLEQKIRESVAFADGDTMIIYLNESDAALKQDLEVSTSVSLTISKEDFTGGIRAVIPDKHILIDNSFLTLQREEQESFIFHGGVTHE